MDILLEMKGYNKMITVKELKEKLRGNNYDLTSFSDEECNLFERLNQLKGHEGKLVRHFKGKFYMVVGIAQHTETSEELVIYKAMYGDYKIYARPIDMFLSKVDKIKYPEADQEYRLEFIELN